MAVDKNTVDFTDSFFEEYDSLTAEAVALNEAAKRMVVVKSELTSAKAAKARVLVNLEANHKVQTKREMRIDRCSNHWFYGTTVLQPQTWFTGGISAKVSLQKSKLQQDEAEEARLQQELQRLETLIAKLSAEENQLQPIVRSRPGRLAVIESRQGEMFASAVSSSPTPELEALWAKAKDEDWPAFISTLGKVKAALVPCTRSTFFDAVAHEIVEINNCLDSASRLPNVPSNRATPDASASKQELQLYRELQELDRLRKLVSALQERDKLVQGAHEAALRGALKLAEALCQVPIAAMAAHQEACTGLLEFATPSLELVWRSIPDCESASKLRDYEAARAGSAIELNRAAVERFGRELEGKKPVLAALLEAVKQNLSNATKSFEQLRSAIKSEELWSFQLLRARVCKLAAPCKETLPRTTPAPVVRPAAISVDNLTAEVDEMLQRVKREHADGVRMVREKERAIASRQASWASSIGAKITSLAKALAELERVRRNEESQLRRELASQRRAIEAEWHPILAKERQIIQILQDISSDLDDVRRLLRDVLQRLHAAQEANSTAPMQQQIALDDNATRDEWWLASRLVELNTTRQRLELLAVRDERACDACCMAGECAAQLIAALGRVPLDAMATHPHACAGLLEASGASTELVLFSNSDPGGEQAGRAIVRNLCAAEQYHEMVGGKIRAIAMLLQEVQQNAAYAAAMLEGVTDAIAAAEQPIGQRPLSADEVHAIPSITTTALDELANLYALPDQVARRAAAAQRDQLLASARRLAERRAALENASFVANRELRMRLATVDDEIAKATAALQQLTFNRRREEAAQREYEERQRQQAEYEAMQQYRQQVMQYEQSQLQYDPPESGYIINAAGRPCHSNGQFMAYDEARALGWDGGSACRQIDFGGDGGGRCAHTRTRNWGNQHGRGCKCLDCGEELGRD